jgi:hypothetical protein
MSFRPVKAENLDVSKVEFSEVKVMNNGGKTVYVNYGGQSIFLQTPEMEIPWDSGDFIPNDKDPQSGKYNIKVSLKDMENNPQVKAFHDAILAIDEKLKETAVANSVAWFKKKNMAMDSAENAYNPMIKVSTDRETGEPDGKYPPQFQFKIVQYDGDVKCKCYKYGEKTEMNVNDKSGEDYVKLGIVRPFEERMTTKHEGVFKRGTQVKMVLRCKGVYLISGRFGCTWQAEQIRIRAPPGFADCSFLDSDCEDEEQPAANLGAANLDTTNFVDSSDEEDGEELTRQVSKVVTRSEAQPPAERTRAKVSPE